MSERWLRRAVLGAYGRYAPWHPGKQTLVRWWSRLLRLDGPSLVMTRTWSGSRLLCSMEDGFERRIVHFGTHEHRTERFLHAIFEPGDVFVDIGANIGVFSLLAASRVGPRGRVFALEPVPATFERLQRNLALDAASNVRAFNLAAWSAAAEVAMTCPVDPRLHSGVFHLEPGEEAGQLRVPAVALDELLLTGQQVDRVNVLKLDIEGAELPALEGARRLLAAFRPAVLAEVDLRHTRRFDYRPQDLARFMEALGYVPFGLEEDYRPRHRPRPLRPIVVDDGTLDNVVFLHPSRPDFARLVAGALR